MTNEELVRRFMEWRAQAFIIRRRACEVCRTALRSQHDQAVFDHMRAGGCTTALCPCPCPKQAP